MIKIKIEIMTSNGNTYLVKVNKENKIVSKAREAMKGWHLDDCQEKEKGKQQEKNDGQGDLRKLKLQENPMATRITECEEVVNEGVKGFVDHGLPRHVRYRL